MARALENQGNRKRALLEYKKITARGIKDETSARSQFHIGECLFADQKFDNAIQELVRVSVNYKFPDWSAKAGLEIGRIQEVKGDKEKALAQYKEVARKYPKHDVATVAIKRITELRRR
jgi:TolA-binding protein